MAVDLTPGLRLMMMTFAKQLASSVVDKVRETGWQSGCHTERQVFDVAADVVADILEEEIAELEAPAPTDPRILIID